jgi:uncharacterized Zn-finger protein
LNQDERRSLKILREKGFIVDEKEFIQWCLGTKAFHNEHPKPQEIANEFLEFESLKENRIECPYCGCHILPKYYLDHVALCKQINEKNATYFEFKDMNSSEDSSGGG